MDLLNLQTFLNTVDVSRVQQILVDLVRLPSENPGGTEQQVSEYCKDFLTALGYEVSFVELMPGRNNVIARLKGQGIAKPIVFSGHMDVVPVSTETESEWRFPPFSGTISEGYIWGRGACDMKGGIAAALAAAELLAKQNIVPPGDIMFALTVDEEDLMRGAKQLAQMDVLRDAGSIVVCDTSHMRAEIASKGRTWAEIKILGKSAHASIDGAGVNAIYKAIEFIQRVKQYPIPYVEHPKAGKFFLNVNLINGGTEPAMVPDRCVLTVDARLVPGQTAGMVWEKVQELIDIMHQEDETFQAEIRVIEEREAWETAADSALLGNLRQISEILKCDIKTGAEVGTTDATFLKKEGVDVIIFGPGKTEEIHCVDERIEIAELEQAVRFYLGLMINNYT
ncbi:MAG: M20 family metallopeptidase [Peptococcaceae bacterium]|nr:M20 family metallopeptidase [Peptococcaceae bacterium]